MKFWKFTIAVIAQILSFSSYGAFIVEGDQVIFDFYSADFSESTTTSSNGASFGINFANSFAIGGLDNPFSYYGRLEPGESIQIDYFDNKNDANPFETTILTSDNPDGIPYYGYLWVDFLNEGDVFLPWSDLEGSIIVTVLTGEVDLGISSLSVTNNGIQYSTNLSITTVPIPGAIWLFGSGLIGLAGFARRKKA